MKQKRALKNILRTELHFTNDYAVLIVSDNASEIKKAFEDSFK